MTCEKDGGSCFFICVCVCVLCEHAGAWINAISNSSHCFVSNFSSMEWRVATFWLWLVTVIFGCSSFRSPHRWHLSLGRRGTKSSPPQIISHSLSFAPLCALKTKLNRFTDSQALNIDDFPLIEEAVRRYQEIFGDVAIHYKFKVPKSESWPKHLQGFELGRKLRRLFESDEFITSHPEKVERLKVLGLDTDAGSAWNIVLSALIAYKDIHGDLMIPSRFVVPDEDSWPRLTRGIALGVRVASIRSSGAYILNHPERKQKLDELGFHWSASSYSKPRKEAPASIKVDYDALLGALRIYRDIYGNSDVPSEFVVPSDELWAEEYHNLSLGALVEEVLRKGKLRVRNVDVLGALDEVEFPWYRSKSEQKVSEKFEVILECLKVYKSLYKNLYVGQLFVVPSCAPWPEAGWGMRLGSRVGTIRSLGSYINGHPDKRFTAVLLM